MTCADVMTSNPSCCVPSESAQRAAQLMKAEDVGPIPIVSDTASRRLIGLVTDRDLAIKVVAEGRDPASTLLEDFMTRDILYCHPDEDISVVLETMSTEQIRRVPVVDDTGRLVGIVAQADVSRVAGSHEVGQVVEEISMPSGTAFGVAVRRAGHRFRQYTGSSGDGARKRVLVASSLGMGLGAGLMYWLRQRRDDRTELPSDAAAY